MRSAARRQSTTSTKQSGKPRGTVDPVPNIQVRRLETAELERLADAVTAEIWRRTRIQRRVTFQNLAVGAGGAA